jgi:hypothetical protein
MAGRRRRARSGGAVPRLFCRWILLEDDAKRIAAVCVGVPRFNAQERRADHALVEMDVTMPSLRHRMHMSLAERVMRAVVRAMRAHVELVEDTLTLALSADVWEALQLCRHALGAERGAEDIARYRAIVVWDGPLCLLCMNLRWAGPSLRPARYLRVDIDHIARVCTEQAKQRGANAQEAQRGSEQPSRGSVLGPGCSRAWLGHYAVNFRRYCTCLWVRMLALAVVWACVERALRWWSGREM